MIPVTTPFLPPVNDYNLLLKGIWKNKIITNMGPLSVQLENELKRYLNVKNLLFVSNGTIALQLAIKALDLKGEIITTPFTYVATSSSIVWEGCYPVYADIDKSTLNIDPDNIESIINNKTCAIMATHVYGNPCDVQKIEKIAKRNNLKVIYDAAHSFGVKVNGKSIFNYGDISTCSTHATKLFHTIEGGFVVTNNLEIDKKIKYMRNFGHNGPEKYFGLGINGKNSEFHSAMGLINLKYISKILTIRKKLTKRYDNNLSKFDFLKPLWHKNSNLNYAYYPIIFNNESQLKMCVKVLEKNNIFGRRYFYPSLSSSLPYIKHNFLTNSENISRRIFCLPLYHDLKLKEVDLICDLIKSFDKK